MKMNIFKQIIFINFLYCAFFLNAQLHTFEEIPSDDLMNLIYAYDKATDGGLREFLRLVDSSRKDAKKRKERELEKGKMKFPQNFGKSLESEKLQSEELVDEIEYEEA